MKTIDFRIQIRTLLERKEVSIAKLSRMVDLNSGTLYNYLQGSSEISAANLAKLFDALNSVKDERKE